MGLPQITVEGRVVADPELRFGPSGVAVCRMRLVASRRKKDESSGEWVDDKTLWINATCFRQLAENVAESVVKGDMVICTGMMQTDEWDQEDGTKRSQTVLIANNVGASLLFRTVRHGEGRSERASAPAASDPWAPDPWTAPGQPEEPPF